MTGNIIGEGFSEKLKREIKRRQKVHGSVFSSKRAINKSQYLNKRNAWLKKRNIKNNLVISKSSSELFSNARV